MQVCYYFLDYKFRRVESGLNAVNPLLNPRGHVYFKQGGLRGAYLI